MKGNFESLVKDSLPVIVDFHALWCSPCKIQSPVLQDLAREMEGKIKVIKIDVDKNPLLANRYQVQSVPTLIIFKNGEVKYRQAGVHTKQQLLSILKNI